MLEILIMTTLLLGFITGYLTFWQEFKSIAQEVSPAPALSYRKPQEERGQGPQLDARDFEKVYEENTPFGVEVENVEREEGAEHAEEEMDDYTEDREGLVLEEGEAEGSHLLREEEGGHTMVDPYIEPIGVELIKVPVVIGENTIQKMQVSDLALDFTAIKVREIDTNIENITYEVIANKVIVQGLIHKQVFYVGVDEVVHHQEENIPFSSFLELPGAQPGMDVQISFETPHVEAQLIAEGTILHQKVVFELFVKVSEIQQIFVAAGDGPLFLVHRVVGENQVQELIEGQVALDIPAIKVSEIEARVIDITTEVIQDKVIIQGVIHKQIFFIGEDNLEHHQAEDMPFSSFVDVPGAQTGMHVQVSPVIEHIKANLDPTGEILFQEIVLELFVKVTESAQVQLVLGDDQLLKLPQVIGENVIQTLKENSVTLPQPAIKIREIETFIQDIRAVVIEDKVIVQGIVHKQIFFIDEENIERHLEENVPFSCFVDVPGALSGMNAEIFPTIEHVKGELDPTGSILHQKLVLEILVKVTETVQVTIEEVVEPYDL